MNILRRARLVDSMIDAVVETIRPIDVNGEPPCFFVLDRDGHTLSTHDNICDAKERCDGTVEAKSVVKDGVTLCRKLGANQWTPEIIQEVA